MINDSRDRHRNQKLERSTINKTKRSDSHKSIVDKLQNCTAPRQLLQFIDDNQKKCDTIVYSHAMKHAKEMRSPTTVVSLMERMVDRNITRNEISYETFFRTLVFMDKLHLAIPYFRTQYRRDIKKLNISLTEQTLNALLHGCKLRGDYITALEVWNFFIHSNPTNNLQLSIAAYASMIAVCARARKWQTAEQYFTQMITNNLTPNSRVCGALLDCYSKCGEIAKMESFLQTMTQNYDITLDRSHYAQLMSGYLQMKMPQKALTTYEQMVTQSKITPNSVILDLYAAIYRQLIAQCSDKETKLQYLDYVLNEIPQIRKRCNSGPLLSSKSAELNLRCALLAHSDDWTLVIPLLESYVSENKIGYFQKLDRTNMFIIDCHHFSAIVAQFIIRYLFSNHTNRRNDIQSLYHRNNSLKILCGKGYHTLTMSDNQSTNDTTMKRKPLLKSPLMQTIENELLQWKPPIRCRQDKKDAACLTLIPHDLERFLRQNDGSTVMAGFPGYQDS